MYLFCSFPGQGRPPPFICPFTLPSCKPGPGHVAPHLLQLVRRAFKCQCRGIKSTASYMMTGVAIQAAWALTFESWLRITGMIAPDGIILSSGQVALNLQVWPHFTQEHIDPLRSLMKRSEMRPERIKVRMPLLEMIRLLFDPLFGNFGPLLSLHLFARRMMSSSLCTIRLRPPSSFLWRFSC